ncbi:phospho-N-acetylmuramoyl-pentapeptide-transferase [Candidatus Saccharibacteria bacterium CG_4_10_14_0_2_um_filter_52_9]|nr:MAG: phospho-N-acetylmuramoyl-pentapeptide-transferase [Candidatus Saccharibacteria bacterium CG_4_10_14_0_2_um_filter_52_9]
MNTLHIAITADNLIQMLSLGFFGFVLSMLITPLYTTNAYKYQWWKRQRTDAWSGGKAAVYQKLHAAKHARNIPTMAGLIFVSAITIVTLFGNLSRGQTWLPLAGLVGAGLLGVADDIMNIRSTGGVAGMSARLKFGLHSLLVLAGGWWFYAKLGVHSIYLPGVGDWHIGVFIIALFWLVVVSTAISVNFSDGLDGLAGGLLTSSFMAYAIIAVVEQKFALAGFCLTVLGTLLSYTWFNIYPARFFMGDVGAFALGTALGIIAVQTDTVYVLPIIGAVYVVETGSVIINRLSRKLRHGKKVFLSSPIHHHFEAIGWPETKVTMRFWILGQVASVLGLIVFLMGRQG